MAIHASANPANYRRSVEKYLIDTFQGATAFPGKVQASNWWWPGRKIDTGALAYFVRVNLAEVGRPAYGSVVAPGGGQGYMVDTDLMLEVWCKRVGADANPHLTEQGVALLRGGLTRGTAIPIRNYDDGDGTTIAAHAIVEQMRPTPAVDEGEWRRADFSVLLRHIEQDTTS